MNSKYFSKHLDNIPCKYERNRETCAQERASAWKDSVIMVWTDPAAGVLVSM